MTRGRNAVRRVVGAGVAVATFVITMLRAAAQAQDQFQPMTKPTETMPAAPLVFIAYAFVWVALIVYVFFLWRRLGRVERELAESRRPVARRQASLIMPSSHFIFIPGVLLVGVIIGWILGSRAARDAFAAELRRRESRK